MSCTPSDAHTGLRVLGQDGQIHCARLFTTRQPMLYGALQPSVLQGSVEQSPVKLSCLYNTLTLKFNPLKIPGVVGAVVVTGAVDVCVTLGVCVVVVGSVTKERIMFKRPNGR